jgi:hypothetical protein
MANIPIPQAGQPIDYAYIYQIVNTLNEISTKLYTQFSESNFNNGSNSATVRLSDMSISAGSENYHANDSNGPIWGRHDFNMVFKYPPVVTATISDPTGNQACWVTIQNVSNSSLEYYVWFRNAGTAQVAGKINFTAIGIPNI